MNGDGQSRDNNNRDNNSSPPKDARAQILARRARFVSVALASVGLMASAEGCDDCSPRVCLEPAPHPVPPDRGTPSVCLEVAPRGTGGAGGAATTGAADGGAADAGASADGGADAGPDAGPDAAAPPPPPVPRVCLRRAPPPRPCLSVIPHVCLSPAFDRPPPPPPPPPPDVPLKGALDGDDDERVV